MPPIVTSASTAREPSAFIATIAQSPPVTSHVRVCVPGPLADATQKVCAAAARRRGGARDAPVLDGARGGRCVDIDVPDLVVLDAGEVGVDVPIPRDAEEELLAGIGARAAQAQRSEPALVEEPVGHVGDRLSSSDVIACAVVWKRVSSLV